jgi:transcriptional regulator with XRE-family HTH domain
VRQSNVDAVGADGDALQWASDTSMRVSVGRCLRERREKLSLTQRALAERSGLRADYISRVERGVVEPRLTRLIRIAKAIDLTPGEFVLAVDVLGGFNVIQEQHAQPPDVRVAERVMKASRTATRDDRRAIG